MVENNYNYIDAMQSSAYRQYSSDQLDNAIQMTGRNCYIFLMDKKETDRTVYGEDKTGRVYLPHFVQRGLYQTNKFTGNLSTINFTETEENLLIQFNFERMVKIINDLKNASSGKLIITSKAIVPLNLIITNEKLILRKYNCTVFEKDLNMPIYKFIDEIKKETNLIDLVYTGNTEPAFLLEKINKKLNPRRKIELDMKSNTYLNTSEVIEMGTIIVSDRYRAYEVVGAYPQMDSYGNYIEWDVQCNLVNLARIDGLPNDFDEIIKKNRYNLGKINVE